MTKHGKNKGDGAVGGRGTGREPHGTKTYRTTNPPVPDASMQCGYPSVNKASTREQTKGSMPTTIGPRVA